MAIFNIKLLRKEIIARETMAFYFGKPDGFEFKAGQFGNFTLINPSETDEEGNTRVFSLACAPSENELMIATRLRDTAFKRVIRNLPSGSELKMDAPYGDFKLHESEEKAAVFLIGGIGIAPVRSIITQATFENSPIKIYLLFSNKTRDDAPFLIDLEEMSRTNPNYTFIPIMTEKQGYISKEILTKYITDLFAPIYYLAGPAAMVSAMRKLLIAMEVNEDNIRTEEFFGY